MEFVVQERCDNNNSEFDWKDVESFTNGFSNENFIDDIQFGKVYKGRRDNDGKDVTVKLLSNEATRFTFDYPDMIKMVEQELAFLELQQNSPCFTKAIGYSLDSSSERLAVVYDLKPINTLHNLLKNDALDWRERMNVALSFARSLAIMHSPNNKCYVRNIDAAHIIIDQRFNPLLIDFSSMQNVICGVDAHIYHVIGSLGYADPDGTEIGYVDREDVFAFGVVLISLISKRIWDLEKKRADPELNVLYKWAVSEKRKTLVHESFKEDQGFDEGDSSIVSQLALHCAVLTTNPGVRPTMAEVVSTLQSLNIFRVATL